MSTQWRGTEYQLSTGAIQWHVVPIEDTVEHEDEVNCLCGPEIEVIDGNMIVIHNVADGRE